VAGAAENNPSLVRHVALLAKRYDVDALKRFTPAKRVYFGVERTPVPGNRTVEIVREEMNVVEVYHQLNHQPNLH
jgi:hypothetical protein